MSKLVWDDPWEDGDTTVYRGETDPPGSLVAEVREYSTGGYMLYVELDVFNLSDGKRLAEAILALVNEPPKLKLKTPEGWNATPDGPWEGE